MGQTARYDLTSLSGFCSIRAGGNDMDKLGDRNYTLLEEGIKVCGNYGPAALEYNVERLYVSEHETVAAFMAWVHADEANRAFGSGNYEQRFREFLQGN